MRQKARQAWDQLVNMISVSVIDPGKAVSNAPLIANLLAAIEPEVTGSPSPSRMVVPLSYPSLTHDTNPAVASDPVSIQWPRNGYVVGITGTIAESDDYCSKVGVILRIQGVSSLTTNGRSTEAYAPLINFRGGVSRLFPFRRRALIGEDWQMVFKVLQPPLASSSATYTPLVTFFFEADEDA